MLVGSMGQDEVDHHAQAKGVGGCHHRVEVRQRPEHRIDVAIIACVIAEILHRRGEERTDPDRIFTEGRDIGQALHDTAQITDAVAIAVLK